MATGIKKQEYSFKGVDIQNANDAPFGISSIGYTKTNAPFSDRQGTILTISNEGGEWKQQIAVPWYGASEIATRYRNNQANWSDWQTIKLGDSGWQSITNSDVFTGTLYYRKISSILCIKNSAWIYLKNSLGVNSSVVLATLPSAYRPSATSGCAYNNSNSNVHPIKIENGEIRFYNNMSSAIPTTTGILVNIVTMI